MLIDSRLLPALLLGATLSTLGAQTQNLTVLKVLKRSGALHSDCWGYTSPTNREIAIVGERYGMVFYETTDQSNIKQVGFFSSPYSVWRDFTNIGRYVYSVSEHHVGIRVIDMVNPGVPKDLGYVQTSAITHAHNIRADPATGLLYVLGTNQGMAIFDTKTTPTNPKLIATWNTSYVHDACIRRGKAYVATGLGLRCQILDARNPTSMPTIGTCKTPGGYSHNCWVSEDDQVLVHTDERPLLNVTPHLTIWDISKPSAPVKKGDYDLGSGFAVHNAFLIGRTCYLSHYSDGFHMLDLSDLTKPKRMAYHDTAPLNRGFCWGIFPFTDSGLVYASDTRGGLFVMRIDCGHMNRYELGTPGSNGKTPRMRFDGAVPAVGAGKLSLDVENLRPNARFVLAIAAKPGKTNILGVQVNVDLSTTILFYFKADANGNAAIAAPVPNDPNLGNSKIYFQIVAEDTGNPRGFSASRGMWTGICK